MEKQYHVDEENTVDSDEKTNTKKFKDLSFGEKVLTGGIVALDLLETFVNRI